jgi:hypothetical protein
MHGVDDKGGRVRGECPGAANSSRGGRGGERAAKGAVLEHGDDAGQNHVRLFHVLRACRFEHVNLVLETLVGETLPTTRA